MENPEGLLPTLSSGAHLKSILPCANNYMVYNVGLALIFAKKNVPLSMLPDASRHNFLHDPKLRYCQSIVVNLFLWKRLVLKECLITSCDIMSFTDNDGMEVDGF